MILVLISAISGGLILYWLNSLTSTTQTVLNVRSPSMIGTERLLRFYGLSIGGIRDFSLPAMKSIYKTLKRQNPGCKIVTKT